jgi:hypothetical protein
VALVKPANRECRWEVSFTLHDVGRYKLEVLPTWYTEGGVWHAESYATTKCSVQRTRKYSGEAVTVHKKDGGLFSYNELSNRGLSLCDWCRDMGMGYFNALKS